MLVELDVGCKMGQWLSNCFEVLGTIPGHFQRLAQDHCTRSGGIVL